MKIFKRIVVFSMCLFLLLGTQSSCSVFKKKPKENEDLFGDKKKKKKLKKCKIESCHVRMNHSHEGTEFKGKRCQLFTTLFAPKQPKYGEALPKRATSRDPHQQKYRKRRRR